MEALERVTFPSNAKSSKILEWKVKEGSLISLGRIILHYKDEDSGETGQIQKFKATKVGTVRKVLVHEGHTVMPGDVLLEVESCSHPTVMRDLCAECGADLSNEKQTASVPMVHCVPDLKVSVEQAQKLGRVDEERLLNHRKLVLLVDLDQTLIHTTNDDIPPNLKDVHHFQLYGQMSPWYHTRLRPLTQKFLHSVSELYELHICTFGARSYAHTIAKILDPDEKLFSHRILSRDECFDPNSKTANLKALFPCGDHMVCIIDDREDVWNFAPNLIAVKPYHFFQHTGDIHAPPGLDKHDQDGSGYTSTCILPEDAPDDGENNKESEPKTPEQTSNEIGIKEKEEDPLKEKEDGEKVVCETKDNPGEAPNKSCENEIINENNKEFQETETVQTETIKAETLSETTEECKSTNETSEELEDKGNTKDVGVSEVKTMETPETEAPSETPDIPTKLDSQQNSEEKCSSVVIKEISPLKESVVKENINPKQDEDQTSNEELVEDKEKNVHSMKSETDVTTKSPTGTLIDIPDPDDYLLYLQDILLRIHTSFYKIYDTEGQTPDMRQVVPSIKRKVLANQSLVFSGVVPTHVTLAKSRSAQLARGLGAQVTEQVVPGETTHLVAARPGTAKVNEARRAGTGIHVVSPEWLYCCAERWEKVEERLFPISRSSKRAGLHEGNVRVSNNLPESLHPLFALSSEDLKSMDQEVEDIFNETDDESAMDRDADSEQDEDEEEEEDEEQEGESSGKAKLIPTGRSPELGLDEVSEEEEENEKDLRNRKRSHNSSEDVDLDELPALKLFRDADQTETPTSGAEEDLGDSGDESELSKMGLALEREFLAD